jgi:chaperonin GroES
MLKIIPRGKRVLVKPDLGDKKEGEILLPAHVEQEEKAMGVILVVGEGVEGLKKGDKVIFGKFSGDTVKTGNGIKEEEYRILEADINDMEHDHILGIIK